MIIGIGIDITEVKRINQVNLRQPRFAKRVLTDSEYKVYQQLSKQQQKLYLAGRFSAKESFSKALGLGVGYGFSFQDLSILNDANGKPIAINQQFNGNIHVSISHTHDLVFTEIILENEENAL